MREAQLGNPDIHAFKRDVVTVCTFNTVGAAFDQMTLIASRISAIDFRANLPLFMGHAAAAAINMAQSIKTTSALKVARP